LHKQHGIALCYEAIADFEVDTQWTPASCVEHVLLQQLLHPRLCSPHPPSSTAGAIVATSTTTSTASATATTAKLPRAPKINVKDLLQSDPDMMRKIVMFMCDVLGNHI
jgi:hypothetical protein